MQSSNRPYPPIYACQIMKPSSISSWKCFPTVICLLMSGNNLGRKCLASFALPANMSRWLGHVRDGDTLRGGATIDQSNCQRTLTRGSAAIWQRLFRWNHTNTHYILVDIRRNWGDLLTCHSMTCSLCARACGPGRLPVRTAGVKRKIDPHSSSLAFGGLLHLIIWHKLRSHGDRSMV